jgi:aminopeptidase N
VAPLGQWRRQDEGREAHMRAALRHILALPGLSRGTFEQASRALGE